MKKIILVKRQR